MKVGPKRPWVYAIAKSVLSIAYLICFGYKRFGWQKVPALSDRGVILASNHASFLDPPLLGVAVERPVTYLAKDYLFKGFVGWMLDSVSAFPIRTKTDDFRSIRELIRVLKAGACVVVYPEGTRSPDGSLRPAESGVGFLALKSGAQVVPIYIQGTYEAWPRGKKFFKRAPVRVYFGDPFTPSEDPTLRPDDYAAVADGIMQRVADLKRRAEAGEKI